uniref:NADH dehydrogenase [ubiquinone] 1 alpha subcomplex assembly factor 3 n=1 Tax=Triticum urartu TaxID=4572 RepID=A0A8R7NZL9_TRIUA
MGHVGCPCKEPFAIRNIPEVVGRKLPNPLEQDTPPPTGGEEEEEDMAAARGQKALATLVRSLRSDSISNSNAPRLRHLPSLRRTFSLYDQINLIDTVPEDQLRFQTYDDTGFKINNVKYEGSLLIVENKIMTWTPKTFADITAESLSIFKIVHPIPEILILGCGKYVQPVSPELRKFIRSTGMKLEAIDSVKFKCISPLQVQHSVYAENLNSKHKLRYCDT